MRRPSSASKVRRAFLLLGRATRLPDKFSLPIAGEPMLDREVRLLRSLGLEVQVVSVRPREVPGVEVIVDSFDAGPLGGLATVLRSTSEPFFLFGGDMPLLDPVAIDEMRRAFDGRSIVPVDAGGNWQVLHSLYAGVDRSLVDRRLRQGDGLRAVVEELDRNGRVRFWGPGKVDPRSFMDVDTSEDYARAIRLSRRRRR